MAEPMQRIEAPSEPWQGETIDVLRRFFDVVIMHLTTYQKMI